MSPTTPFAIHRILIAIDGSQVARWAVDVGRALADQVSAKIMLVHVIEPLPIGPAYDMAELGEMVRQDQAKALLSETRLSFQPEVQVETALRDGNPASEITAVAKDWHADVIVMGTRGRGRLAQFVLGSTADAVMRRSPCPVITVANEPRPQPGEQPNWIGVGADEADPISAHCRSSLP